jgi:hypothetical protein
MTHLRATEDRPPSSGRAATAPPSHPEPVVHVAGWVPLGVTTACASGT